MALQPAQRQERGAFSRVLFYSRGWSLCDDVAEKTRGACDIKEDGMYNG